MRHSRRRLTRLINPLLRYHCLLHRRWQPLHQSPQPHRLLLHRRQPNPSMARNTSAAFNRGKGLRLPIRLWAPPNFGLWAYVRYLNQKALEKSYTDSFGRTFEIDQRNDIQFNKVNLSFSGWLLDPNFRYLTYVWTNNTSQGDGAQVVVAGNFKYRFNKAVDVGVGIDALPGTRSMYGNFPLWNKVDMRTMADEFFRPSYTTGIWSAGVLNEGQGLTYKLMLGNNLSQLGVNAAKLDGRLDTWSGRLQWQPTTGEFGPQGGWGDFEMHEHLATQFGLSATYSREDRQSQPGTEDVNNSQIRLSDGTRLFVPDAFATGGSIERATYQMVSADAALKYQGFDLSTAFYSRWLDSSFKTQGDDPGRQPVRLRIRSANELYVPAALGAGLHRQFQNFRRVRRSVGHRCGCQLVPHAQQVGAR